MRTLALENNIHIFCLPPHTTHRLQPLDVGVFGPLQAAWQNWCNDILTETGQEISQPKFISEYMAVHDSKFTTQTILKVWEKAGLNPYDPEILHRR
jgi:DDE superfamily endonuclease